MYSHPDQVGSSCKLSQSQYIIEPNLTEVDVSQVQHLDPNYLYIPWAQIFGRRMYTYIPIEIYVYIYRHIPTPP